MCLFICPLEIELRSVLYVYVDYTDVFVICVSYFARVVDVESTCKYSKKLQAIET